MRIPLHDSYFAEPIVDAVKNASEVKVELFGVLIASRTRLRARLVGVGDTLQRGFSDEGRSASMQRVPATAQKSIAIFCGRLYSGCGLGRRGQRA